ncbi:hypothetical protein [Parasphingorhabdus sp.]|uniref:hypothetical protein n=1 Tax=Parasphingorhabdus sp. TaxID=2709688 RepID=UPI0032656BB2
MAQRPNIAICILSFDGFSDLWAPFFQQFFETWPDCPYSLYLLANHKTLDDDRVTTICIGDDIDWSTNLQTALPHIKEERVLFIFDDFFLVNLDVKQLQMHFEQAERHDWPYLTLYPNNYREETVDRDVRRINKSGIYCCTLVYGLIRKDYLSRLLKKGETAWEFEINVGQRVGAERLLSADRQIFWHRHLLRKGVWMRPGYNLMKQKNYPIDPSRPVETRWAFMVRETKEFLFRQYHRRLPPALITRLERRR